MTSAMPKHRKTSRHYVEYIDAQYDAEQPTQILTERR